MSDSADSPTAPSVVAVSLDDRHRFSKRVTESIELIEGIGVRGDVHSGATDQHRSHARRDPTRINLRQVHLIHAELFDEVAEQGFTVHPGEMGENVTTRGIDLLGLPQGAVLRIGDAEIEVTGLRNPCSQIDGIAPGLMKQMVGRNDDGAVVRRSGIMGVVRAGGLIRAGDEIRVELPAVREALQPV